MRIGEGLAQLHRSCEERVCTAGWRGTLIRLTLVAGQAKHGGLLRRCSEEAGAASRGGSRWLLHAEGAETGLLGRWLWLGKEASGRHRLALRALRTE